MNYYKKIVVERADFEEIYWDKIVDPDGVERNRLQERDKVLKNLKSEISFINNLSPSKILDVGCGLGFLLSALDDRHEKFGVEISSFASKYAGKYAQKIYNEPFEDIDFGDENFDCVISHHVIEHVENTEIFLKKNHSILKKDGILILSTPDFESVCAKLFKKNYRMLYDKTHTNLFSFDGLKKMVTDFGFEISEVDFPYFETEFYTYENIQKMLKYKTDVISPPCWGNFMTFYLKKN